MSQATGLFNIAAFVAIANAITHLVGSAIAGFSAAVMPAIAGGFIWLMFALGLIAKLRWMAYFAFLLAIIGGLFVYAQWGTNNVLPDWSLLTIGVLNAVIALVLFLLIWRRKVSLNHP